MTGVQTCALPIYGFLDFSSNDRYLPEDPRQTDIGVEYGLNYSSFFGQFAFTNGNSDVFFGNTFAETKAAKVGMNHSMYQGGISFYDDFQKNASFGTPNRSTRWAYYGMTHYGPFALLGEVGAGTDDVSGVKTNLLAWFAELDYAPTRTLNFRLRTDYLNTNRASDEAVSEASTHYRYALEGEEIGRAHV